MMMTMMMMMMMMVMMTMVMVMTMMMLSAHFGITLESLLGSCLDHFAVILGQRWGQASEHCKDIARNPFSELLAIANEFPWYVPGLFGVPRPNSLKR